MENKNLSNARVDVADVLRGLAVMGIIILHSIEHFNFYYFPEKNPYEWMGFTDKVLWNGLFFAFSGKAYAIFALLFGFSFYIQYDNQQRRGKDFRLRFLWRLFLLFIIGQFNAMFFTGEILTMYAMIGVILVLCCRMNDNVLFWFAIFLILQPVDWGKLIYALCVPDYVIGESMAGRYFEFAFNVQKSGTFFETVKMNLWEGQLASLTWALEHGRVLQTAALFLLGLWVGRKKIFIYSPVYEQLWLKILGIAFLCFFPLSGINNMLPDYITRIAVLVPLQLIISSLANLSFMVVLVTAVLLTFYRTADKSLFMKFAPYGKMSMTNYISQSVIGSLCFYYWGFFLGEYLGITYSFLFGLVLFICQFIFCTWWMKKHKHGPFEGLWKRLTWIGSDRS